MYPCLHVSIYFSMFPFLYVSMCSCLFLRFYVFMFLCHHVSTFPVFRKRKAELTENYNFCLLSVNGK
jgi:hypothetical protein